MSAMPSAVPILFRMVYDGDSQQSSGQMSNGKESQVEKAAEPQQQQQQQQYGVGENGPKREGGMQEKGTVQHLE